MTTPHSCSEVRSWHLQLLQRYNKSGAPPEFLHDAALFIESTRQAGRALDDEYQRMDVQQMLDYWATVLFRAGEEPPDATLEEFDLSALPQLADDRRPYLGLETFKEDAAGRFFGRASAVADVVRSLRDNRVVLIVGASGSGRSSLVQGGVVPSLKQNALLGSASWRFPPVIVPGSDPILALARIGVSVTGQNGSETLRKELAAAPTLLAELLAPGGTPALLVVDQVEELFTLSSDAATRAGFVKALLAVAAAEHRLLLILRGEYEPQFTSLWTAVGGTFARVTIVVPAVTDLREVIEKPAAAVGLRFQEGLVEMILRDLEGEPLPLPLLQFTLMKLWEQREGDRVTVDAYRQLGGIRQVLSKSAEAFYAELDPSLQEALKVVLLRLLQVGDGADLSTTRVRISVLQQLPVAPNALGDVLEGLLTSGLLQKVAGESATADQVELPHEILARSWPRLSTWIDEERPGLAIRRRFDYLVSEWQRLGSATDGLLDKTQLREAEDWIAGDGRRLGYHEALPLLVSASRAAMAAREARRNRSKGAAAVVLLVVFAVSGWFAYYDSQRDALKNLMADAYATSTDRPHVAVTRFEDARLIDPGDPDVLRGLARGYAQVGRSADAIATYLELLAIQDSAESRVALGALYLQSLNTAQAREQFVRATTLDPGSFDAALHLGIVEYHEGLLDESEKRFAALHAKFPDRPEAHVWSAAVHYWKGQLDQTIEEYTKALRLGSRDVNTHLGLAQAYYAKENYELARAEYNRAIALAPDDIAPRQGLALTYYAQRQYQDAVAEFERALQAADPSQPQTAAVRSVVYNGLGYSYLKLGDLAQAARHFESARALNDAEGMAWVNLGIVYAQQRRDDEALSSLRGGIERMKGTDPYTRLVRAFYTSLLSESNETSELAAVLAEPTTTVPSIREVLSDAELLADTALMGTRAAMLARQLGEAIASKTTRRAGL